MARGRSHATSFTLCDSRNYLNLRASVSSLVLYPVAKAPGNGDVSYVCLSGMKIQELVYLSQHPGPAFSLTLQQGIPLLSLNFPV